MQYFAYLDEFGHIGPFISRNDARHNDHPIFGLAGFVIPATRARNIASFFYKLKTTTLKWELDQTNIEPYRWEKKGSAFFTLQNLEKYREVRRAGRRLLAQIHDQKGFVFYVGTEKHLGTGAFDPKELYKSTLRESINRLDRMCIKRKGFNQFAMILDEHQERDELLTAASVQMFRTDGEAKRSMSEPPFQVESHRFQTVQAADWIAAIVGRIMAYRKRPDLYSEWEPFEKYFGAELDRIALYSSVRARPRNE